MMNFLKKRIPAYVDTGINRLGISYSKIPKYIYNNKNINIVISHLASADDKRNPYNI